MLQLIERSIIAANLGVTPQNDGSIIRIFLPPMTEERRKEIVKRVQNEGEHSKVAIRNIRRDAIEQVKKMQKNGLSEDIATDAEKEIQEMTNKFIALVEKHLADGNQQLHSAIDAMAKTAPAGSEGMVAIVKQAAAAASSAFDQVNRAARQAVDMTEANIASVTKTAAPATSKARRAA
jgi:hypothetical protein